MTAPKSNRGLIIAGLIVTFGAGYFLSGRVPIDSVVKNGGFFQTDVSRVLSTTVESLREENSLDVYSYKGTATVEADRSLLWVFHGHQTLIVPASVSYHLPLSNFDEKAIDYDEKAKVVRVKLPPLVLGDIAFQPEQATTINGGTLTFSEEQTEALRKMNYANARRAMIAQAQQPGFWKAAQRQAIDDVETYFTIPLKTAHQDDVRVIVTF